MLVPLFQIEVRHRYDPQRLFQGLSLVPSPETKRILARLRLYLHQADGRLCVMARKLASGKPLIPIEPGTAFRFHLVPASPDFYSFTLLPFPVASQQGLYLGNRVGHLVGSRFYLSKTPPGFEPKQAYKDRDLTWHDAKLYECIRDRDASESDLPPPGASLQTFLDRGSHPTPGPSDVLRFSSGALVLPLSSAPNQATTAKIEISAAPSEMQGPSDNGQAGQAPSSPGLPPVVFDMNLEAGAEMLRLNLGNLPEGRYSVRVTAASSSMAETDVYNDPVLDSVRSIGVVEIIHDLNLPNGGALLDAAGSFLVGAPTFTIAFLNTLAYWRFFPKNSDGGGGVQHEITDTSENPYLFESCNVPLGGASHPCIQSKTPIPLSAVPGEVRLKLTKPTQYFTHIPTPSFRDLKASRTSKRPTAEVFLRL